MYVIAWKTFPLPSSRIKNAIAPSHSLMANPTGPMPTQCLLDTVYEALSIRRLKTPKVGWLANWHTHRRSARIRWIPVAKGRGGGYSSSQTGATCGAEGSHDNKRQSQGWSPCHRWMTMAGIRLGMKTGFWSFEQTKLATPKGISAC